MHNFNALDRDAEPVRDELCKGRLMALAVAVRAGEDGHAAGRMHAYRSAFEEPGARAQRADNGGRSDAAGLDIGGNTEAAQFSAGCSLTAPVLEARVVGGLQREIQCREVIAAVVLQRDRCLVRVGLLWDKIAA